jgi:hypothetical protein
MAYFIHNKYDKDSKAKVTEQNNNFTYNADNSVTVIDYYGLLEENDLTYKSIDTSNMGIAPVEVLKYRTPNGLLTGNDDIINGLSNNIIKTSVSDLVNNTNAKIGSPNDLGSTTLFGLLNTATGGAAEYSTGLVG